MLDKGKNKNKHHRRLRADFFKDIDAIWDMHIRHKKDKESRCAYP